MCPFVASLYASVAVKLRFYGAGKFKDKKKGNYIHLLSANNVPAMLEKNGSKKCVTLNRRKMLIGKCKSMRAHVVT